VEVGLNILCKHAANAIRKERIVTIGHDADSDARARSSVAGGGHALILGEQQEGLGGIDAGRPRIDVRQNFRVG
jgi:hypothetical protein